MHMWIENFRRVKWVLVLILNLFNEHLVPRVQVAHDVRHDILGSSIGLSHVVIDCHSRLNGINIKGLCMCLATLQAMTAWAAV